MPVVQIPIIKGDKVGVETDYRDALPVNMYAVSRPIHGGNGYMICYPGLALDTLGVGKDRGGFYNDRFETVYRVSGGSLIQVNTDNSITSLGLVPGARQASMAYSFQTQCVVANSNMFLYDPVGGFVEVTDSDLGNPIDVVWVDGYYFLTDGENIYHTDIANETAIDPLKFATAEFMPDKSLGLGLTQDNKVMVFGRYSLEYFINVASENFAFQRVPNRAQKIGIVATHAKCESGGKWYITGGRKADSVSVHIINIGSSQKVSTREIDKIIGQYTEPELADMRMDCRTEDNVTFVHIHLPNETLCFNESIATTLGVEMAWSILKTCVKSDDTYRGINMVFDARLSRWGVGDKLNSNIGIIDNSKFTHYGEMVEWLLYTPFMGLETMSIDEIELETIPGFTATKDATVAFSVTFDGVSYSKEWFAMYGEPLDYGQRFIQRRVGYVREWIGFKFRGATRSRMAFAILKVIYG
jgi:hypothetical protein